jgi:predicted ester cyclase
MTNEELDKFAQRYAEAWCSQDPEKVAAFYANSGSISVNGAPPVPIAEVARGFMRDFPDMVVRFNRLENMANGIEFHWTFTGINTAPGGTGKKVLISGYELWKIDNDGLVAESRGHFDAADYERQLGKRASCKSNRPLSFSLLTLSSSSGICKRRCEIPILYL